MKRFTAYLTAVLSLIAQNVTASITSHPQVRQALENPEILWSMALLGPQGETPVFTPAYARYRGVSLSEDGGTATLEWGFTLDRDTTNCVKVSVSMEEGLPAWRISVDLRKGWIVDEVEFPVVRVSREEGSKAVLPMGYGAEFDIPVNGGRLETRYPSVTGGMQFVLSHSPKGCYYMASLDREGSGKYFYIKGTGSKLTFSQKIPTSYAWTRAGHFELPWATVFAYNEGTWDETLLKWYRPFALSTQWGANSLQDRHIAEWIKHADVWIRPKNMFPEVIDGVRKAVAYYGKGLGIHWYHWHNHAYDTMYPEYFPPKPGFREMVAEVQAAGAHVTPYINGRLWDPANDSYKSEKGYLASCRKPDGTLYTEIYPTSNVPNTVTCPSSPIWQAMVHSLADSLVHGVGTHGVYIDQISAAASEPCYAANHPHAKGAGAWWPKAYRHLLGELGDSVFTEGQAVTSEENAEPYLDLFDMLLIVNTPHSADVKMLPVFPLIYSDRVVYSGLNYYHETLNDGHFLYNNARSLLWGAQLGWIQPDWLFAEGNEREIKFLKTLGDFRAANHDVFYGGNFIRELAFPEKLPEIQVFDGESYPVLMGAQWNAGGAVAYILVNMGADAQKVTLPTGEKVIVPPYQALRF